MAASASASRLLCTPSLNKSSLSWKLPSTFAVSLPRRNRNSRVFVVFAMDAKPTVLVAENLGEADLDLLKDFTNVDCSYNRSPEELFTKISLCDALIVCSGTKVSREVFESSGGRLKVVGRNQWTRQRWLPEVGKVVVGEKLVTGVGLGKDREGKER